MKNISLRLTAALLVLPSWGFACLGEILTPEEAAAKAHADAQVFWAMCLVGLAVLAYRSREPLGAWLARLRAQTAEFEAAVASRTVAKLAVGVASISLVLFVYGNMQLSALPSEGCGDIKLFKALF
ncbi:hypothetical protein EPO15_06335 [bacterium]|nr:MAG: hypothetical protein EPO15_06335 [bacterium]